MPKAEIIDHERIADVEVHRIGSGRIVDNLQARAPRRRLVLAQLKFEEDVGMHKRGIVTGEREKSIFPLGIYKVYIEDRAGECSVYKVSRIGRTSAAPLRICS